jgi:hypothetical protein
MIRKGQVLGITRTNLAAQAMVFGYWSSLIPLRLPYSLLSASGTNAVFLAGSVRYACPWGPNRLVYPAIKATV